MQTSHRRVFLVFASVISVAGISLAAPQFQNKHLVDLKSDWRNDPAWNQDAAEWALYDATRPIYGRDRHYEASIFTNKQLMDPATNSKTDDPLTPRAYEVFKLNVSELIETENYAYRFLTTCFVRTDTLQVAKLVMSSQDSCGSTYRQFDVSKDQIHAQEFCYFPGTGFQDETYRIPDPERALVFHDALTLTLRDFIIPEDDYYRVPLNFIQDQTTPVSKELKSQEAVLEFIGIENVTVPYGNVETYHIRVTHPEGHWEYPSHYWFATDPQLRHVLVKYDGAYGIKYELKRLEWWAYWKDPKPE